MAQTVENLPAKQETQVQSLGREDALEKGMATHSSILAWEIPWTVEPGGLQSMGFRRVGHDRETNNTLNFSAPQWMGIRSPCFSARGLPLTSWLPGASTLMA